MKNTKTELIVALDLPNQTQALQMAKNLKGIVSWLKVGLQLFIACGPSIVKHLQSMDFKIFLDLKFYDIPNTVAMASREAIRLGASMLTVHAQGGKRMCQAAQEEADKFSPSPLVACVSVLTSFGKNELPGISENPENFALYLANQIVDWKMRALVCSPLELPVIKSRYPDLKCVCPGIRLADNPEDDQRRIATPQKAAKNGADYIVMGRPILRASNPAEMAASIINNLHES